MRTFAMVDRLSRQLSTNDPTDYWKSAPYLLNFMEGYQLKREMKAAHAADGGVSLAAAIDPDLLLPLETIEAYRALDPGNARLRGVADDLLASEAWRLLWMPPSLPYYEQADHSRTRQRQPSTKRLIFSSWAVVPPAVSAILSYEAERQMMRSRDPEARNDAGGTRGASAVSSRFDGSRASRRGCRRSPSSTRARRWPSSVIRLAVARDLGAADGPVSRDALVAEVQRRIEAALTPLARRSPADGLEDERWYWAAPLLLDRRRDRASDRALALTIHRVPRSVRRRVRSMTRKMARDGRTTWTALIRSSGMAFSWGGCPPTSRVPLTGPGDRGPGCVRATRDRTRSCSSPRANATRLSCLRGAGRGRADRVGAPLTIQRPGGDVARPRPARRRVGVLASRP